LHPKELKGKVQNTDIVQSMWIYISNVFASKLSIITMSKYNTHHYFLFFNKN